jgi:hypothetical protein
VSVPPSIVSVPFFFHRVCATLLTSCLCHSSSIVSVLPAPVTMP